MTKARWFKAGLALLALAVFVSAGAPALPVSSAGTAKPVPGPGLGSPATGAFFSGGAGGK